MADRASELLQACTAAHLDGADFPTIWNKILKRDSFVAGIPVQGRNSEGPTLEVPLFTGQRLIFDSHGFSIA